MGTNVTIKSVNSLELADGISSLGGTNAGGIKNSETIRSDDHITQLRMERYKEPFINYTNAVINVTITYDTYKFTDLDTIWEGPKQVKRFLEMKRRYLRKYYFVNEKHANGRWHMHGQIYLGPQSDSNLNKFDCWDNLIPFLKKKIGNVCGKWNVEYTPKQRERKDTDDESFHASYWDYCHKETTEHVIHGPAE